MYNGTITKWHYKCNITLGSNPNLDVYLQDPSLSDQLFLSRRGSCTLVPLYCHIGMSLCDCSTPSIYGAAQTPHSSTLSSHEIESTASRRWCSSFTTPSGTTLGLCLSHHCSQSPVKTIHANRYHHSWNVFDHHSWAFEQGCDSHCFGVPGMVISVRMDRFNCKSLYGCVSDGPSTRSSWPSLGGASSPWRWRCTSTSSHRRWIKWCSRPTYRAPATPTRHFFAWYFPNLEMSLLRIRDIDWEFDVFLVVWNKFYGFQTSKPLKIFFLQNFAKIKNLENL